MRCVPRAGSAVDRGHAMDNPASRSRTDVERRPVGVWLVCCYLLLSEGLAVMAFLFSWSPTLSKRLIGVDLHAELDTVHLVLIAANTVLWLIVAFDLYNCLLYTSPSPRDA